ncbi:MAG TPA: DUF2630 family protein [Acidimicrobiales bacterium]|jgi:hypothetical protein
MDDRDILGRIDDLIDEEHHLREAHAGNLLSDEDRQRLQEVEVQLDRCWDLLRQRRAKRSAGLDPDESGARDAETVEHYQQ